MLPFSEYELAQKFTEEITGGQAALISAYPRLFRRESFFAAGRVVNLLVDQLFDTAGEQQTGVGGMNLGVSDFSHFGFLVGVSLLRWGDCRQTPLIPLPKRAKSTKIIVK